jgi:hypothetical protein
MPKKAEQRQETSYCFSSDEDTLLPFDALATGSFGELSLFMQPSESITFLQLEPFSVSSVRCGPWLRHFWLFLTAIVDRRMYVRKHQSTQSEAKMGCSRFYVTDY